jgi:RNA polymerase sigma-70 factor, ECF subfamily
MEPAPSEDEVARDPVPATELYAVKRKTESGREHDDRSPTQRTGAPTVTTSLLGSSDADATLIERSWTKPDQFAAIFSRYFSDIHSYLSRRVGTDVADDLAAEAFLAAFARRKRYDTTRHCARPWLYGIATNLVASHRRHERRFFAALARAGTSTVVVHDEERLADRVSAAAVRGRLTTALAALAPGDRDVLLLVALADLGYHEVAEALGIPYGTVCSRLNRARTQIRASLGGVNPAGNPQE